MPAELQNPKIDKPWYARLSIGLGVVGSIAIGVATNFLTDYIKDLYAGYTRSTTDAQISKLEDLLNTMVKARNSTEYYISYINSKFFEGLVSVSSSLSILTVSLICATQFYAVDKLLPSQSDRSRKYLSVGFIVIIVAAGVISSTGVLKSIIHFTDCLNFSLRMRDYDSSVATLKNEISEFKSAKK